MSDDLPKLTVTMLGPSGCGKSAFLLGMYTTMSLGVADYFLHARNNDLDLFLTSNWEDLLLNGKLPPPTGEEPKEYPLMLKTGMSPVLAIDWLDYRGKAMHDYESKQDVATLLDWLRRSDAVFLAIDGFHLCAGVRADTVLSIDVATRANRMRHLLNNAFEGRAWPPMVVVVTKADLLGAANPGKPDEEIRDGVVADVRRLLPICFQPGVTTMVCPVSLGDFGADPQERVARPGSVRLVNVHKPLLFTLARTLENRVGRTAVGIDNYNQRGAANHAERERLDSTLFARFRTRARGRLDADATDIDTRLGQLTDLQAGDRARIRAIAAELRDTPVFIDGDDAEWTLG